MGLFGIFFVRRNLLVVLMAVELVFLGINYNLLIFSLYLDSILGQSFFLLILTTSAAEAAVGLSFLIILYRMLGLISIEYLKNLKG